MAPTPSRARGATGAAVAVVGRLALAGCLPSQQQPAPSPPSSEPVESPPSVATSAPSTQFPAEAEAAVLAFWDATVQGLQDGEVTADELADVASPTFASDAAEVFGEDDADASETPFSVEVFDLTTDASGAPATVLACMGVDEAGSRMALPMRFDLVDSGGTLVLDGMAEVHDDAEIDACETAVGSWVEE